MAKPAESQKDTFDSLLDRIGILREELISVEQSLTRMQTAESQKPSKPSGEDR